MGSSSSGAIPGEKERRLTFVEETVAFWYFLNVEIEVHAPRRRGPKPSAEKLFKTALASFTARKIVYPYSRGRSPQLPQLCYIEQVWYLLFGEVESGHNIKKVLPKLVGYLAEFEENHRNNSKPAPWRYTHLRYALSMRYEAKARTCPAKRNGRRPTGTRSKSRRAS